MKEILIAPSLLSCDFTKISSEAELLNKSRADWYHLDVMDGVFVPNISFGLPIIKAFDQCTAKPLDVHLMIVNPDKYVGSFAAAGADHLTVHIEACDHLHRTVQMIKAEGMKAGVALNPHTSISELEYILEEIDIVCLMSVNPGFGGQKFIDSTLKKTEMLASMIQKRKLQTQIEIDGGVTLENAKSIVDAGANVLVAGSTVFNSNDPMDTIFRLKQL